MRRSATMGLRGGFKAVWLIVNGDGIRERRSSVFGEGWELRTKDNSRSPSGMTS
jgi:hypothetical protein